MSHLITILRAAHCRSTHHFFVIDALRHVHSDRGGRLADLMLRHFDQYLLGAKDPDKEFKDFQNHVLHVGDNNWGGAPRACEKWLSNALRDLNDRRWEDAAYSLGVLSHYFTDPIMPLHTGSSDAEGVVHRAMEWSICKAYDEIHEVWNSGAVKVDFELTSGSDWIRQAVLDAASRSHEHYTRIIEIYDLARGSKNPPEGLNAESRQIIAEMFGISILGWAKILERVAQETTSDIPETSLSIATVVAAIDMPVAWVVKKISSASEQRAVCAIFKEYESTGSVQANLPAEIRTVRSERANDRARESERKRVPDQPMIEATDPPRDEPAPKPAVSQSVEPVEPSRALESRADTTPAQPVASGAPRRASVDRDSDLVDAPSIGPKTARRFEKIGIVTIGQFVDSNPDELASLLATRWIKPELVSEWQDQSRFVMQVPSLCGFKSQLLVAMDCRCVSQLAEQDPAELASRIAELCETKEGERILRSSRVPDQADVAEWIADAQSANRSQAA